MDNGDANESSENDSFENDPCDFPFVFASETTSKNFTSGSYEAFLRDQGVHHEGMWRTECIDHKRPHYGAMKYDDAWVIPSESVAYDSHCRPPEHALQSWTEYYYHRELSMHSPAAILMTYPMTLYYILTTMLKVVDRDKVTVHIVGAEKEADLIPAFKEGVIDELFPDRESSPGSSRGMATELQYLLPSVRLAVVLVGPSLSRRACSRTHTFATMTVRLHRGLYHSAWKEMEERPDVIVGFNAGLAAYPSWIDTIKLITDEQLPAYFTDYCVESCEYARQQIDKHRGLDAKMSQEVLNPFRSPIRICDLGSREPRFSNNYVYSLERG